MCDFRYVDFEQRIKCDDVSNDINNNSTAAVNLDGLVAKLVLGDSYLLLSVFSAFCVWLKIQFRRIELTSD